MNSRLFHSASALTLAFAFATSPAHAQAPVSTPAAPTSPATASEATQPAASSPTAVPPSAVAATAQSNGGLQEIVVTAQKRSENIQSVPIAITAVTAGALQAKGITDVASIGKVAPNVTFKSSGAFGGSSSVLYSYIRGIGQNDFAFNLEAGVGVYVDGVYLARNIGSNTDLLDIERVEVLKGPQGTLFGRNTIGGAINIVTADPGNLWKYKLEGTTGSYNRADFRGTIDAPVIPDVLRLQFSVSTKHRDGYQERIPYTGDTGDNPIYLLATNGAYGGPPNTNTNGAHLYPVTSQATPDHSGNQNETSFRAKALFTPNDKLTVRLIGDYLNVHEEATPFSLLQVNQAAYVAIYNTCITGNQAIIQGVSSTIGVQQGFPANGISNVCNSVRGNPASPTGTQPPLSSQGGANLPYDNRYVIRNADGSINPDKSYASGANFNDIDNYGINGQIEYKLSDEVTLKSITAYRHLHSNFGVDIGGAPFSALSPTFEDHENQFSEEGQVLGKFFDNRWNMVVGGYYFHEYGSHNDEVPFLAGQIQIDSPGTNYDTKSYAAYMHNNIAIIPDKLGLTLGVRYTHDDKHFEGTQRDENEFAGKLADIPAAFYPDPNDPYLIYPPGENHLSFNNVSYRVGAEYHFNSRIMAYGSYATGFKGGGWTTRLTAPLFTVNPDGTVTKGTAPTFRPEKAQTAEVGLKTELFDHHARVNVALFNTQYHNIQLTFQDGTSPVTANGGNGRIRGAEAELNLAPLRNWSIDASAGYLDAKYTSITPGVDLTINDKFVNTPKWTIQAGTAYTVETESVGAFIPRIDWNYSSRIFNDEANSPQLMTPKGSMFDGSLTWKAPGNKYEVQAGVTNITDRRVVVSGYTNALAIYAGVFTPPREWFLTFRVHN